MMDKFIQIFLSCFVLEPSVSVKNQRHAMLIVSNCSKLNCINKWAWDFETMGLRVASYSRISATSMSRFQHVKQFCLSACSNLVYILNLGLWVIWTLRHLDI